MFKIWETLRLISNYLLICYVMLCSVLLVGQRIHLANTFFSYDMLHNMCWNYLFPPWASYQISKIAGCACAGNAGNVSFRRRFQRKPLVSDPGMHHSTCVTHVPWCMSGSLTCGDGENVPGIPGACAPAILCIWQEAHWSLMNDFCHLTGSPSVIVIITHWTALNQMKPNQNVFIDAITPSPKIKLHVQGYQCLIPHSQGKLYDMKLLKMKYFNSVETLSTSSLIDGEIWL